MFYPVLNQEYAEQIARDWNSTKAPSYVGYVTRFRVRKAFLDPYDVCQVATGPTLNTGFQRSTSTN
jgi:hypothetical protein